MNSSTSFRPCNPEMLGKVGEGFHTHQLDVSGRKINIGFAIFDLLGTLAISFLISKIFKVNFLYTFVLSMIFAIGMHWYFCVPTKLNTLLGLD